MNRYAGATGALLGLTLLLGTLLVMNRPGGPKKKADASRGISFEVKKERPKTFKKKKVAKKRSLRPRLDSILAGRSFGLSRFENLNIADRLLGDVGDVAMTAETVDEPPRPFIRPPLDYPPEAREKGIRGHVTLNLLIDDKGKVASARVLSSAPSGVFDQSALAAVGGWVFRPAVYRGKNVKVWVKQRIAFALN